ncbi:MAG: Na+/H+ antiporter NhaA [Planctomycetes bacterium]|nr:Na+/H+ antiporter NhaA [Planctomycetota bacterium]
MQPATAATNSSPLARLARSEAFPGILLVAAATLALFAANSPWSEAWTSLWQAPFSIRIGDAGLAKPVQHWINDGLMVLFFFFVGLEIKHEALDGGLRSPKQAALPIAAALGGMLVPALVYSGVVWLRGDASAFRGWGIPMATDIAFALGVLALLGKRVPPALKVFLATLAIVDDLGAVLVIALFYTEKIAWLFLLIGVVILLVSLALNRLGVRKTWPYVVLGILIWLTFLQSGVHATIAGTLLALTIPARRELHEVHFSARMRELIGDFERAGDVTTPVTTPAQLDVVADLQRHSEAVQAPLQRMVRGLSPVIAHFILPLFALANAGVDVRSGLGEAVQHAAAQGVFLGLLLGKPIGVFLATWLCARMLRSALPEGVNWGQLHGAAWLAGIGFTMSLFIDGLAFANHGQAFHASKVAVLSASLLASVVGAVVLLRASARTGRAEG